MRGTYGVFPKLGFSQFMLALIVTVCCFPLFLKSYAGLSVNHKAAWTFMVIYGCTVVFVGQLKNSHLLVRNSLLEVLLRLLWLAGWELILLCLYPHPITLLLVGISFVWKHLLLWQEALARTPAEGRTRLLLDLGLFAPALPKSPQISRFLLLLLCFEAGILALDFYGKSYAGVTFFSAVFCIVMSYYLLADGESKHESL